MITDYLSRLRTEEQEREDQDRARCEAALAPARTLAEAALPRLEALVAAHSADLAAKREELDDLELAAIDRFQRTQLLGGTRGHGNNAAGMLDNLKALRKALDRAARPIEPRGPVTRWQVVTGPGALRDQLVQLADSPRAFQDAWQKFTDGYKQIEAITKAMAEPAAEPAA